jgi:putative phosphoribosyl transferase
MDTPRQDTNASVEQVHIPIDRVRIEGELIVPTAARAIVILMQGIGSDAVQSANDEVAKVMREAGLAVLHLRLLTHDEEELDAKTEAMRFDVNLLAKRLIAATWWLKDQSHTAKLPIGYFGMSMDAAAALVSAADATDLVDAVVSVAGHTDLAGTAVGKVIAPTFLIVGDEDAALLRQNETAFSQLAGEKNLERLPGTADVLSNSASLGHIAELAKTWFVRNLLGITDSTRAA